jgi:hypothetical protein
VTQATPKPRNQGASDKVVTPVTTFEDSLRAQHSQQDLIDHLVNQLPDFLGADQAVFALKRGRSFVIQNASAVANVNRESDYIQRLEKRLAAALTEETAARAFPVSLAGADGTVTLPFGIIVRLPTGQQSADRVLLMARGKPWKDPEIETAAYLGGVYAHALDAVSHRKRRIGTRAKTLMFRIGIAGILAALFLVQVRVSIIAPARIVPVDPVAITSGVAGRVTDVAVAQGDAVMAGDVLFRLDDQIAADSLLAALQQQAVAVARQGVLLKQALTNPQAREELTVAEQDVKVAEINVREATHILDRHVIKAAKGGQVLSDNPDRLLGEIIEVGTQLTQLYNPTALVLEVDIPVADGLFAYRMTGARVFLNVDPLTPRNLVVSDRPQSPRLDERGGVSYPVRMAFADPSTDLIVGMEGSAQVLAPPQPLIYTLLRRPINWIRVRLPAR